MLHIVYHDLFDPGWIIEARLETHGEEENFFEVVNSAFEVLTSDSREIHPHPT